MSATEDPWHDAERALEWAGGAAVVILATGAHPSALTRLRIWLARQGAYEEIHLPADPLGPGLRRRLVSGLRHLSAEDRAAALEEFNGRRDAIRALGLQVVFFVEGDLLPEVAPRTVDLRSWATATVRIPPPVPIRVEVIPHADGSFGYFERSDEYLYAYWRSITATFATVNQERAWYRDRELVLVLPPAEDGPSDAVVAWLSESAFLAELVRLLDRPPRRVPLPLRNHLHLSWRSAAAFLGGRQAELEVLFNALEDPSVFVLVVVGPEGVGKTSLIRFWLDDLATRNTPDLDRICGWSFDRSDEATRVDRFWEIAFDHWFLDPRPAWQPLPYPLGQRLAGWVKQAPTVLVLDGIESLQDAEGHLSSTDMSSLLPLLKDLATGMQGLCVVTSRLPLVDLQYLPGVRTLHLAPWDEPRPPRNPITPR